uniref:Uncharacterized protein n=1 Tax=Bacterium symbiont subsp. Theonella swinhoei (strain pTSMAC1) TaxID=1221190 RepID=J9ZW39_BACS1|nr:unknown protein [bacterium symbiont of Theonella swinhoei pTSMAC1]
MLEPLSRWHPRCTCPLLPANHRPSPRSKDGSAYPQHSIQRLQNGGVFRDGYQLFLFVQASRFACHPGRSHRRSLMTAGQLWRLRSSRTHVVTFMCIEYANRPNRAIDGRGLSPLKTHGLAGRSWTPTPAACWVHLPIASPTPSAFPQSP